MKCTKNIINEDEYEIVISDENKNKFKICCDDADLYWAMDDYYKENEFIITKDNKELFLKIHYLFSEICRIDNLEHQFVHENRFEWISEARIPEISNKLIIERQYKSYIIKFIQNPKDTCSRIRNSCYIFFPLSESKNQEIVSTFQSIFLSYQFEELRSNQKRIQLY